MSTTQFGDPLDDEATQRRPRHVCDPTDESCDGHRDALNDRDLGQHTPGPWEVTDDQRHIRAARTGRDVLDGGEWEGALVAQVLDSNWRYRDNAALEANAQLIAAAPALLEALEALVTPDGIAAFSNARPETIAARAAIEAAR